MTIALYARRKQWPLTGVTVRLRHSRIHAEDCAECETGQGMLDRIERDHARRRLYRGAAYQATRDRQQVSGPSDSHVGDQHSDDSRLRMRCRVTSTPPRSPRGNRGAGFTITHLNTADMVMLCPESCTALRFGLSESKDRCAAPSSP